MLPSSLDAEMAQSSSSSKKLIMALLLDRDIQHERLYPLPPAFDDSSIDSRIESILQERISKESAADEYNNGDEVSLSRESLNKLMTPDENKNDESTVEAAGDTAKSIEGFQKSMHASTISAVDDTLEQLRIWKDKRNAAKETQCLEDNDDDDSVAEANHKFSELIDDCIRDNPNTPANDVLMEREKTQGRLQKLTEMKSQCDSESFKKGNHFDVSVLSNQYTDIANYKSKAASENALADKLEEEGAKLDEDFEKLQNQLLSCGDELDDYILNNS